MIDPRDGLPLDDMNGDEILDSGGSPGPFSGEDPFWDKED